MTVQVAFDSQNLRKLCNSRTAAERALGHDVAQALMRLLADLDAAENIGELLSMGLGTTLADGKLWLILADDIGLFADSAHQRVETSQRGADWQKVSRIKLLKIGAANG